MMRRMVVLVDRGAGVSALKTLHTKGYKACAPSARRARLHITADANGAACKQDPSMGQS